MKRLWRIIYHVVAHLPVEEPRPRRHRTQGEFDDWPSNAQMEYFKRGGR